MYKFHLKFNPTSRIPMINAIMRALGINFVEARDWLDNGLVVTDRTLCPTIKTLEWAIERENNERRLVTQRTQPGVPYTPFMCDFKVLSYESRPVSVREPIEIKELIEA